LGRDEAGPAVARVRGASREPNGKVDIADITMGADRMDAMSERLPR
jgi:hypothetical protein